MEKPNILRFSQHGQELASTLPYEPLHEPWLGNVWQVACFYSLRLLDSSHSYHALLDLGWESVVSCANKVGARDVMVRCIRELAAVCSILSDDVSRTGVA